MDRRRAVITGMGAVTPLGLTAREFWKNLVMGKSGVGPMTLCDPTLFPLPNRGGGQRVRHGPVHQRQRSKAHGAVLPARSSGGSNGC